MVDYGTLQRHAQLISDFYDTNETEEKKYYSDNSLYFERPTISFAQFFFQVIYFILFFKDC